MDAKINLSAIFSQKNDSQPVSEREIFYYASVLSEISLPNAPVAFQPTEMTSSPKYLSRGDRWRLLGYIQLFSDVLE